MANKSSSPRRSSGDLAPPRPLGRHSICYHARSPTPFCRTRRTAIAFRYLGNRLEDWRHAYLKIPEFRWQAASFHHRIRSYEDYNEKLDYMNENPVEAGLVERIEDWPYRGDVFQHYHWWP